MDIATEAARLRAEAEARPLKLPVRRKVDERHLAVTEDGLQVWFTIQVSPHARIQDVLFERRDRPPADDEVQPWLSALLPGQKPAEAPGIPGSLSRRFELFDSDGARAPVA